MTLTAPRRPPDAAPLRPPVKVWLEADDRYVFGLGIAEILQAVERAGSIRQAAADLGKSYRHVWGRVKDAEQTLGQPLVRTQVGGKTVQRSALMPAARRYTAAFLGLRDRDERAGAGGVRPLVPGPGLTPCPLSPPRLALRCFLRYATLRRRLLSRRSRDFGPVPDKLRLDPAITPQPTRHAEKCGRPRTMVRGG